jgi:hypothetical protein
MPNDSGDLTLRQAQGEVKSLQQLLTLTLSLSKWEGA